MRILVHWIFLRKMVKLIAFKLCVTRLKADSNSPPFLSWFGYGLTRIVYLYAQYFVKFYNQISTIYARKWNEETGLTRHQIAEIRENFCRRKVNKHFDFCNKYDEIPDWVWDLHKESIRLCKQYYHDFHGIDDFSKTTNKYLAAGGMGMVTRLNAVFKIL